MSTSRMSSSGTRDPLLASCSVSPSASSIRSASRTGSRLAPSRAATSSCRIHCPGAISPERIASRREAAIRSLAAPRSVTGAPRWRSSPRAGPCCADCVTSQARSRERLRVAEVRLAVRVADQLELHPPRGEEVDPALALVGAGTGRGLTEHLHTLLAHVRDRGVQVVDVEGDVVAADVAVPRRHRVLVGRLVVEDLEDGLTAAPEER